MLRRMLYLNPPKREKFTLTHSLCVLFCVVSNCVVYKKEYNELSRGKEKNTRLNTLEVVSWYY